MASQISDFCGFTPIGRHQRLHGTALTSSSFQTTRGARTRLTVESFKKANKKKQLVLVEDVEKLGKKGDLVTVAMGYWRNYLGPQRKAKEATQAILDEIRAEAEAVENAKLEAKEKASRLAVALKTIGKFTIKKKVGENNVIFGSVTRQDIADAVYTQTGQQLDKREISLPDIKTLGTYGVTVKLHAEVVGQFNVIIVQEKNAPGRAK